MFLTIGTVRVTGVKKSGTGSRGTKPATGTSAAPIIPAQEAMFNRRFAPLLVLVALVSAAVHPAVAAGNLDPRLGVAEGLRNVAAMKDMQAGWERSLRSICIGRPTTVIASARRSKKSKSATAWINRCG